MATQSDPKNHTFRQCLFLAALAVTLLFAGRANAWEYQLESDLTDNVYVQENYLDRSDGGFDFDLDRRYNLLDLAPMLTLTQEENLLIFLRGDLLWRYEPDTSPSENTSDDPLETKLTSAFLALGGSSPRLILGLQPIQFGQGLIAADDAPGATLTVDFGRWSLAAQAAWVMDHSPMAGLKLGYEPGAFEHLAIFGVWFQDDQDAWAKTLGPSLQWLNPTSRSDLYWLGASAELFAGDTLLSLICVYELGDVTFNHRLGQAHRDINAYLADMSAEANLTSRFSAELFFFLASGGNSLRDDTWGAFVSPLPSNPRMLIFFDPEWLDYVSDDRMTFGGATFYGVAAPGLGVTLAPLEKVLLEMTGALFYLQQAPQDDRDTYGWEIDLKTSYQVRPDTELYLNAARFTYGNYFESGLDQSIDATLYFSIGGRISF